MQVVTPFTACDAPFTDACHAPRHYDRWTVPSRVRWTGADLGRHRTVTALRPYYSSPDAYPLRTACGRSTVMGAL